MSQTDPEGGPVEANSGSAPVSSRVPVAIARRLKLPVIAAPMLRISTPGLVVAACRAGVIGAFPTINARTTAGLTAWLTELDSTLTPDDAPYCPNLIMRRPDLDEAVEILASHRVEMVLTSVGSPAPVVEPLHEAGTLVLSDVASVEHARKAIDAGVDGLVLLTAGAGGNSGWLNPFAFVRAVREFYDGPVVLAGGVIDGHALNAALVLGCDLVSMGTRFIATSESAASRDYQQMLIDSSMDDVIRTRAFTGMDTNMLLPSIVAAGLDPDRLDESIDVGAARKMYGDSKADDDAPRRWSDIWSAGHTVSGIRGLHTVAEVVEKTATELASASRPRAWDSATTCRN